MKVKKIVKTGEKKPVYDIQVKDEHSYILENGSVSHNSGFIYASSIVVAMKKLKLKEDDAGNKISEVRGIRSACKIMKTRYSKPFESVQIKIPYESGMNPYSGLVDMFEARGILTKDGNRLRVELLDGTEIKLFRKAWESNEDGCLDKVMSMVQQMPGGLFRSKPEEAEAEHQEPQE